MKNKKTAIFIIATLFIGIAFFVIFAEILLRIAGFSWETCDSRPPLLFEFDEILGWKNKPGTYALSEPYNAEMSIWQGGLRTTRPERREKDTRVVLLGCSYTMGWAIPDNETFAWKLQERFPSLEFLNYGTNGYGTYQSLLVLEKILAGSPPPAMVLYGFIPHHENRNVAAEKWLRGLAQHSSKQGYVELPYCTVGFDGGLIRQQPISYSAWPLRGTLSSVAFLERLCMQIKTWRGALRKRTITQKLLLEMNTLCAEKNSEFAVLLLDVRGKIKREYVKFFSENNIAYLDCTRPGRYTPAMWLPDGHPNIAMNSFWADRIGAFIVNQGTVLDKSL